ncbi:MAG: chromosome segregation SMC family protein [Candidatus Nanoarchaeia archaeon]|nr:chromosome segregation SMC family protein [Candidatus Nanoarchaeia archaeon]MDD5357728.1 chromosome segregation SMC family protein [Candidatus Nanoarchaeia archaeon]MDD5588647.1 chromosome segregation SMC family protein [Candidatus Nanoarchaeia archaeon]
MMYIKKLVMYGFKSFVRKTEIPLSPGINVIVGANGSGKSNVSDALCFVLGRLSIKSMRAAKAGNLIFLGSKAAAPAKEAMVEMVLDNSDGIFSIDKNEISVKRIVRRNGQSIYKINDAVSTRQEVLSLLAQGGIDPNGFNIVLQGEIQNFARMQPEERRKVIEEVSGISIYEMRKEKSLSELEKTEEKLKEVLAILRERTIYLNNLEKERQQALKFKKLESDVKKFKASIIYSDINQKKKISDEVNSKISQKNKEIEKEKKSISELRALIENLESKISTINSTIQKSTGLEQERLNQEIANIRAELAGMNVRLENYENKISSISKEKQELQESLRNLDLGMKDLQKPLSTAKNQKEIESKKQELEKLEEQRKKFYTLKSELKSLKERIQDKKTTLNSYINESEFLLKQVKSISQELSNPKTTQEKIDSLKMAIAEKKNLLDNLSKKEISLEKLSGANEYEIDKQKKLVEKISKMDICPLCKSTITKEHIDSMHSEIHQKITSLNKEIENSDRELKDILQKKSLLNQEIEEITSEISRGNSDLAKLSNIHEKQNQIKTVQEKIDYLKGELSELLKREKNLENSFDENSNIEQKYETLKIEVQEISLRSQENMDSEISFKQRELERGKISFKQLSREEEDLSSELVEIKKKIKEKNELLEKKKKQESELVEKFQKMISERDSLQRKIRDNEIEISKKQNIVYNFEQELNNLKIDIARINAEIENLETEMLDFPDVEIIKTNRNFLTEKLAKTQELLSQIGNVNLRSLEVYDSIKNEYDSIKEKTEIIAKEKEGILKIIHEIDVKKKKTFLQTLNSVNEIFSRNFSQLSQKGHVYLELEDKKEPFNGGVNIIVKTGHGKYFDVKSLSGGEQTLVALSLIFAIQELKPYYFYILDEIDAALDKRNSERLAELLKKYMQRGQYIVISHNDEVIANATNLYGISMHDGISKIISLKM